MAATVCLCVVSISTLATYLTVDEPLEFITVEWVDLGWEGGGGLCNYLIDNVATFHSLPYFDLSCEDITPHTYTHKKSER